jgi:hypothetical protein
MRLRLTGVLLLTNVYAAGLVGKYTPKPGSSRSRMVERSATTAKSLGAGMKPPGF